MFGRDQRFQPFAHRPRGRRAPSLRADEPDAYIDPVFEEAYSGTDQVLGALHLAEPADGSENRPSVRRGHAAPNGRDGRWAEIDPLVGHLVTIG